MSATVIDMTAELLARRDAELRCRFGIEPGQTATPVGYAAALLVERTRILMAGNRPTEERQ